MNLENLSNIQTTIKVSFYQLQLIQELVNVEWEKELDDCYGSKLTQECHEYNAINRSIERALKRVKTKHKDKILPSNYDYVVPEYVPTRQF